MSSFITMNRFRIKKYIGQLFDLNAQQKLIEMGDILNLLRSEIYKYGILMHLDFSPFGKSLSDIKYDLGHYTRADWRMDAIRGHLKALHDLLIEHEKNLSLHDKIVLIAEDLDRNLSLLFTPEGTVKDDLLDSFDSLQSLAPEIKELGFETFQLYRQTVRSANACKPFLPLEPADVDEKGRILIRPNEIKNLRAHTSPLLSALGDLIAVFHQPPAPPKEKDKKEKLEDKKELPEGSVLTDIDELERHRIFSESADLIIKQGWSWGETCRHLNISSDDLLDIWDLDVVPTSGDEHEEKESEKTEQKEKTRPGEKLRPEKRELEKFEEEETAERKAKTNQSDAEDEDA